MLLRIKEPESCMKIDENSQDPQIEWVYVKLRIASALNAVPMKTSSSCNGSNCKIIIFPYHFFA